MKINIKKSIALLIISTIGLSAQANVEGANFPYGKFKERDLRNPYVNQVFEKYINDIQRKDIKYTKLLNAANDKYQKKIIKENKRQAYREEDAHAKIIHVINTKEKNNYNVVKNSFYVEELKIFNNFVKNIKSNPRIPNNEKIILIEALKPVQVDYERFNDMFKFKTSAVENNCFKPLEKEDKDYLPNIDYKNNVCLSIYKDYNDFAVTVRNRTSYSIKDFMNKYLRVTGKDDYNHKLKQLEMQYEQLKKSK